MNYRFEIGNSIEHEIKRVMLERFDQTIDRFHEDDLNFDEAIHQLRKNMKKVRGALRLVRDVIGKSQYKEMNIAARDIARLGAEIRESKVRVETMNKLNAHFNEEITGQFYPAITHKLKIEHNKLKNRLTEQENISEQIVQQLNEVKMDMEKLSIPEEGFNAFYDGLKRVYKRGLKAMKSAQIDPTTENHHEWRKRVKYLWYQLRILKNSWPRGLKGYINELHELSNYLGDDHDLYDLRNELHSNSLFNEDEMDVKQLDVLIDTYSNEKRDVARILGEKIYAENKKAFVKRIKTYWEATVLEFVFA